LFSNSFLISTARFFALLERGFSRSWSAVFRAPQARFSAPVFLAFPDAVADRVDVSHTPFHLSLDKTGLPQLCQGLDNLPGAFAQPKGQVLVAHKNVPPRRPKTRQAGVHDKRKVAD
jgi:hypothetical protein